MRLLNKATQRPRLAFNEGYPVDSPLTQDRRRLRTVANVLNSIRIGGANKSSGIARPPTPVVPNSLGGLVAVPCLPHSSQAIGPAITGDASTPNNNINSLAFFIILLRARNSVAARFSYGTVSVSFIGKAMSGFGATTGFLRFLRICRQDLLLLVIYAYM